MNALPNSKPRQTARNRALQTCIDRIEGLGLCSATDTVLLAVSGGADSMAMAHAFRAWQRQAAAPIRVKALIVDHGLRADSREEAGMVEGWLKALGIDAAVATVTARPPRNGIQAWARRHRYRLLAQAAAPDHAVVVTAHHRGDQAETVLMRSLRGSGLAGLAGMARHSLMNGMPLCRPFLDLDPGTLHASLDGSGIPTIDDPSNQDSRFERVRVRRRLAETGAGPQLCRLAGAAARLNEALLAGIDAAMDGKAEVSPMGYGWINHAAFTALPDAAAETFLSRMIRAMATAPRPVRKAGLERLAGALRDGRTATLGGCEWRFFEADGDRMVVCLAEAERLPPAIGADGGGHLYDQRWQVFLPGGFEGRLEAIGAERFAALKRLRTGWIPPRGIPARAFWRIPVLVPGSGRCSDLLRSNATTLDESTFVPHLLEYGGKAKPSRNPLPSMRFAGGRRASWRAMRYEGCAS